MNAPVRIVFLSAVVLVCTQSACRGDISVNWLDEPLELGGWWNPPIPHSLDIDGNGTIDFSFWGDVAASVGIRSEGANRYLITPDPPPNIGGAVSALEAGFLIGPESGIGSLDWFGDDYDYWSTLMLELDAGRDGEFWGTRAYVGIEFQSDDGIHYGWFDVEGDPSTPYAVVYGWAYESTPGMGIIAGAVPEPSSVLLFASGMVAILMFRTKKRNR
jgi:hypothetical protein